MFSSSAERARSRYPSRFPRASVLAVVASGALAALLLSASPAYALDDCPAGSIPKSEEGFSWCEPTVCGAAAPCGANEVCRSVPLCLQVGSVGHDAATVAGDAGKRLVATQRCAPDKSCPSTTTCSDLPRCISKAVAEKMGVLADPATASSTNAGGSETGKKSACGCDVPGHAHGSAGVALAGLVVAAALGRRARVAHPRPRRP